jgi:hypothetical protein
MVHSLETGYRCTCFRELRVEDGGEEVEEEVEGESDLLHASTTVELVVDQEHGEVVTNERDRKVDLRRDSVRKARDKKKGREKVRTKLYSQVTTREAPGLMIPMNVEEKTLVP